MTTKLNMPAKSSSRVKRKSPKVVEKQLEDSIPKPEEFELHRIYDEQPDIM